jgi:hypothetical protein
VIKELRESGLAWKQSELEHIWRLLVQSEKVVISTYLSRVKIFAVMKSQGRPAPEII